MARYGNVLMASEDTLRLFKCFYYLISFNLNSNGKWETVANEKDKGFSIGVPT